MQLRARRPGRRQRDAVRQLLHRHRIQNAALELCTADAKKHLPADGQLYYPYALFPKLITYEVQSRKTVTCSLTRNNGSTGTKLYSKL